MGVQVVWHGTEQESRDLVQAIANNCACEFGAMGMRLSTCAPHEAMAHDQRWLDWLLYLRRIRDCLRHEEWSC